MTFFEKETIVKIDQMKPDQLLHHSPMGINGDCLLFLRNLSSSASFSASVINSALNCWTVGAIFF